MTSLSSPGPLNVGNLVSAAFTLYRSHLKTYLGIAGRAYLWVLVPIYGWAKFSMLSGLISRLTYQELIHQPETVNQGLNQLKSKLWRFLLAGINILCRLFLLYIGFVLSFMVLAGFTGLLAVGSTGAGAPALGPVIILGVAIPVVLIGFLALLFWFVGRWSVAELPIACENATASAAVDRSWELTRQSAFRVQLIMFVAGLITMPLIAVCSYIPNFIAAFAEEGSTLSIVASIIAIVGGIGAGIVTLPFWQVVKALIYYDLRSRTEGIDLKLRRR